MPTLNIIALLILGVALVVGSLLLRVLSGGRHEIKTTDLVFLVIPLLVVALATGKLGNVEIFGVKADFSKLWVAAAQTKLEKQVVPAASATVQDAVEAVRMAHKGSVSALQQLIERKIEALEFKLGHGGYDGTAIETYFEVLSGSSHLRVVVVDKPDGKLFGVYNVADLIGFLRVAGGDRGYQEFQQLLNSGSEAAWVELTKLPGFIGAEYAVTETMSKRDALARMEQLNTNSLPVMDRQQRFVGTVERSKLTASLILAVTDTLEGR